MSGDWCQVSKKYTENVIHWCNDSTSGSESLGLGLIPRWIFVIYITKYQYSTMVIVYPTLPRQISVQFRVLV